MIEPFRSFPDQLIASIFNWIDIVTIGLEIPGEKVEFTGLQFTGFLTLHCHIFYLFSLSALPLRPKLNGCLIV